MNIATYLQLPGINKSAFARDVGVSYDMVYQWEKGIRPVAIQHCAAVERASDGKVTRQELRPADWKQIWPELVTKRRKKPVDPTP